MDWIVTNWETILTVVTVVAVGATWLWLRYKGQQDRLENDLREVVRDGLEYLKDWAGDRLAEVEREDCDKVADWIYDERVAGTALEGLVTREQLRIALWTAFGWIRRQRVACNALAREL